MQRRSAPSQRAARLATATPADRDRFVDLIRALSIAVVVLGHWLMAAVVRRDGVLRADNALAHLPWLQHLTWALQVLPLFFVAAGFTNARALRRPGTPAAPVLTRRVARVAPPVVLLVLTWLVLVPALTARDAPRPTVVDVGSVVAQPLWFLSVYLLVAVVAPVQLRVHRRYPWLLLVVLPVATALLDVGRLTGWSTTLASVSYLTVFAFAQELGFWYFDGQVTSWPARRLLAVAGAGSVALVGLTTAGPYPVSMVGLPGEGVSNMSPPTVCILLLALVQTCLLLSLRAPLVRWLGRPGVWRVTVAVNRVVLTVFLWHLTAVVLAAAVLRFLGQALHQPGSLRWWADKPEQLLLATAILLLVVLAASPVERRAAALSPEAPAPWRSWLGTVVVAMGLAALAGRGFVDVLRVDDAVLGVEASPVLAAGLVVAGWWVAAPPTRGRPEAGEALRPPASPRALGQ